MNPGIVRYFVMFLAALLAMPATAAEPNAALRLAACTMGKAKLPSHCGTLLVYEDRAKSSGRTIALKIIEIDAVHRSHRAIFWNPGGPGASDSDAVPYIADGLFSKELLGLHDRYDLVFIDNRGVGASRALDCELFPVAHPEMYFRELFPTQPLRSCYAALSARADLSDYTTDTTVDDLDAVRAALQYRKIVLDGGSYGTMLYLDFARRYPAHVESLVLQGVVPPGLLRVPLEDARGAQDAMNSVIADCGRDGNCHERYPKLAEHFTAVLKRFGSGPIAMVVSNAATKRPQTVALSREVFVDRLRQILYASESAAYVPYVIEQAYQTHYAPLAKMIDLTVEGYGRELAMALNLSVTCAEDNPFITEADVIRTSANSFEGDARVRAQQRACAIWRVNRVSPAFDRPVRSSLPVLMISGAADPASPPQYGRAELPYLSDARQVVIPHAGHEVESACTDALIVTFVRTAQLSLADSKKCVDAAHRPPFATSMQGFGQ